VDALPDPPLPPCEALLPLPPCELYGKALSASPVRSWLPSPRRWWKRLTPTTLLVLSRFSRPLKVPALSV
jgi:hypothetical protein